MMRTLAQVEAANPKNTFFDLWVSKFSLHWNSDSDSAFSIQILALSRML